MKFEYLYIFVVAFIQGGGYDFAGWYGIFKDQSGHKWEWLYRVIKEILDFVVTPVILIWGFGWNADLIGAFYIFKWFGWADGFYIAMWKIFNPKRDYTENNIWWMWWTPLGASRSEIVYRADIQIADNMWRCPNMMAPGYPDVNYIHLYKRWWFKKGVISLREFQVQLVIGLILSYSVYHFELVSKLINWIF